MVIDAVVSLVSLVAPPIYDFIKKKFLKPEEDTVEATLSALADTKPEIMVPYISAITEKLKVDIQWFNRDVIGTPHLWVIDLRAAIRPVTVVASILILGATVFGLTAVDPGTRVFLEANVSNWFGSRIVSRD
jgi:hypothetical protein